MSDVGGPKINLLLVEVSKSNQLQPESLLLIGESHSPVLKMWKDFEAKS